MQRFLLIALFAVGALSLGLDEVLVTKEFVKTINDKKPLWTSSTEQGSFFKGATKRQVMQLMGARTVNTAPVLPRRAYNVTDLPTDFDAAVQWPTCPTINTIRDQSACGSCWAFGAAEAMSDRYCTYGGPKNLSISTDDLVACCGLFQGCGFGCNGGEPSGAWAYWVSTGLVDETCDPYPFPKCEHHISGGSYPACPSAEYPTPACKTTCTNGASRDASRHKGKSSWGVTGEQNMMTELYNHGPFEVAFTVYDDFVTYKSGVYHHVSGNQLGGHAVKVTGWGVLNGVKYWKIANSWNPDWGSQGFFLIQRGNDECGIEDQGVAGEPLI